MSVIAPVPAPRVERVTDATDAAALRNAAWIDLIDPSDEARAAVERETGLYVFSREDTTEIESSSRLYLENTALYLTMPVIARDADNQRFSSSIGFIFAPHLLITVRFAKVLPIELFAERLDKIHPAPCDAAHVFVGLLEALADGMADNLERSRAELDQASHCIFGKGNSGPLVRNNELRQVLTDIGRVGDLLSTIRDSQLALGRLVHFVSHMTEEWLPQDLRPKLKTLRQDIASLADYDSHLTNKVQFLLDAILGFINIDQSNTIKLMTVVGVIGVPPTLIASIYGMNFELMPELKWAWGYPFALALMLLSAVVPVLWFKRKGWL
jgi:magnesium transporter